MLKLLIVDDEEMTRHGLKEFVPWRELGIEVAAEASDGIEGIEQAERIQPDLVLCDVRMPRMDGIAFAKRLREINPDCRLIFISGYTDSEYLKSAIQLKAVDYIEKPIQMDELYQVLERTVQQYHRERVQAEKYRDMHRAIHQGLPQLTGILLKQWMNEPEHMSDSLHSKFHAIGITFPWEEPYTAVAVACDDPSGMKESLLFFEEELRKESEHAMIGDWSDVLILLIPGNEGKNEGITALLYRAITTIKERTKANMAVAFSGWGSGSDGGIELLKNALKALQYRFYTGWNRVIFFDYFRHRVRVPEPRWKDLLQRWEGCWKHNGFTEALEWIEDAALRMREPYIWPVETARELWLQACLIVWKYYPEALEHYDERFDWKKTLMHGDESEITKFLRQLLTDIDASRNQLKSNLEHYAIRGAVDYMLSHLSEPMTIQKIADHVHLTPTYLCLLFKKETGQSIHDYLTEARMERAKKLLQDRSLRLYEIAEQAGYNDPKYFAKVFRKTFGCNPSDFRHQFSNE